MNVGDKVKIKDCYLPITNNWLGEGGRLKTQGPYTIDKLTSCGKFIAMLSGIQVCLINTRFDRLPDNIETTTDYNYEVVHCTSEEEWKFVLSKLPSECALTKEKDNFKSNLKVYSEGLAINWEDKTYCGLNYFKKLNTKIYTFQEYCDKFKYEQKSKSVVGRYIKALVDKPNGGNVEKDEIGIIVEQFADNIPSSVDFPNHKQYIINRHSYLDGTYYEIMPVESSPDNLKKTRFEIGKWYRFTSYANKTNINYAKCKDDRSDGLNTIDWILNSNYNGAGSWANTDITNLVEITDLSEIQQYLPDGHIDKIKMKWIPKAGDWIYLTQTYSGLPVGKVARINESNAYPLNDPKSDCFCISDYVGFACMPYKTSCRKALPHEIPEIPEMPEMPEVSDNMDIILEKAKIKYPIGTKFICPSTGAHDIVSDELRISAVAEKSIDSRGGYYVYYKGQWADITSVPKVKKEFTEINIGDWYKSHIDYQGKTLATTPVYKHELIDCPIKFNESYKGIGELKSKENNSKLDTHVKSTYVSLPELKVKTNKFKF